MKRSDGESYSSLSGMGPERTFLSSIHLLGGVAIASAKQESSSYAVAVKSNSSIFSKIDSQPLGFSLQVAVARLMF
jgi:hypothetical protein